jgi:hypothetical protein
MQKPSRRVRSPLLFAVLVLLCAATGFALMPVQVLTVRAASDNALLYCSPIAAGDEFIFESVNSIFRVPVQDTLRVLDDQTLQPVQVVSSAAVLNYLGIPDYQTDQTLAAHGVPSPARFREIRLKVDARGQQHLIVKGQDLSLYQLVPDATTVVVSVAAPVRIAACR